MPNALVATSTITLDADTPCTITPQIISLKVDSVNLTAGAKEAAINNDMQAQIPLSGVAYIRGKYVTPGTLSWDGKLNDATLSSKLTKNAVGAVLDSAGGTIVWTVVTPAICPKPPCDPPEPDPETDYPGTWVITANPNSILTATS